MRTPRTTLLAIAAVALAVAGCGGSEVSADEVPGDPPALTSPSDNEIGTGSDTGTGTEDDATIDPEATEDPAATDESVVPVVPEEDPAAAAVPEEPVPAPEDTTAEPVAPEEAPPDQLDSFCEQNVGAC
jgi:hypothetical protein